MGAAFKHLAVQRHLVSRANPQAIADLDLVQRDIGLAAVVNHEAIDFETILFAAAVVATVAISSRTRVRLAPMVEA